LCTSAALAGGVGTILTWKIPLQEGDVFYELMKLIQEHLIFYNCSNNPQLPVAVQLAIFLNGVGHYGNAATMEDISDWAGVSVGTIYNCYKWVMIAILQHHDHAIHFDPLDHEDQFIESRWKFMWKKRHVMNGTEVFFV
jgi:hypothetical protein